MIEQKIRSAKGRIGIYYENLVTGEKYEVLHGTDDDVFESASVIKLWVMSCAYELAEQGKLDLDQKVMIREEDLVPGPGIPDYADDLMRGRLTEDMFPESGILNYLQPGLDLSIRDLIRIMILISDNSAMNILTDILGMDNINNHIRGLGASKTILKRKLFDTRPEVLGRENLFSLKETADYFRLMYEGKLVSEEASKEMCAILQNQQNTYKMPFYIRRLPIAHKTGEDTGIENDVGIVFSDEPYIFCFAANEADEPEAVRLCQDISLMVSSKISV